MPQSIKQQYYKVQKYWFDALKKKHWKLAIWVTQYPDIEIVSQFLDIEGSALGETKEIHLKFSSIYTLDHETYEQDLWNEFSSWFSSEIDPKYDMHKALVKDNFLKESFIPNIKLKPTITNLISEIERFRSSLLEIDINLIIEFSLGRHQKDIGYWMQNLLTLNIPDKIRFVAIDIAKNRFYNRFRKNTANKVFEIHPELEMVKAMKNEMKKETEAGNPHTPDAKYKLTVLELMEVLPNKEKMIPLIKQLFIEAEKIGKHIVVSTHLIVAHAYNTIKKPKKGLEQINKGLKEVELLKNTQDWYPLWRSCILFKSAFLIGIKKENEAFEAYELLSDVATEQKDVFYIMESYRLCASIKMKKKHYDEAFEYAMLGLYGGSFLELKMRRNSTYLYLANLAYNVVYYVYESEKKRPVLYEHLEKWLGDDWQEIISIDENLNNHYAPLPEEQELITG